MHDTWITWLDDVVDGSDRRRSFQLPAVAPDTRSLPGDAGAHLSPRNVAARLRHGRTGRLFAKGVPAAALGSQRNSTSRPSATRRVGA